MGISLGQCQVKEEIGVIEDSLASSFGKKIIAYLRWANDQSLHQVHSLVVGNNVYTSALILFFGPLLLVYQAFL